MIFIRLTILHRFVCFSFLVHFFFSVNPTLVSEAIPGVRPTSLLFATGTDCVLVGDSEGQVTVYKLKNFTPVNGTEVNFNRKKRSFCIS